MINYNLPIRTLGLYQPYAGLMLYGKIETRWVKKGRQPPFPPGQYILYATKKSYSLEALNFIAGEQLERIKKIIDEDDKDYRSCAITGHAIAFGVLKILVRVIPSMEDETFVQYSEKKTHVLAGLVFEDVKRIEPFEIKGKQGIGFLSEADKQKIKFF
jgi:hypothetical protein